jgi:hypothetical protein
MESDELPKVFDRQAEFLERATICYITATTESLVTVNTKFVNP